MRLALLSIHDGIHSLMGLQSAVKFSYIMSEHSWQNVEIKKRVPFYINPQIKSSKLITRWQETLLTAFLKS